VPGERSDLLGILGVPITNVSMERALWMIEGFLARREGARRSVFFVNAHTLNLAARDRDYLEVLRSADHVFGDGTGVRWAARLLHGVALAGNVNGTDLVPRLLGSSAAAHRRYYLLGASADAIARAAEHARRAFADWTLVGHHDGYVEPSAAAAVIEAINAAAPDLLLVGMGNPRQERWVHLHRARLEVPLVVAVGGLFDYWAGDLVRAPQWMRRIGFEWLHLMLRQPRKVPRYLLGNPAFLLRVVRCRLSQDAAPPREQLG
jgi:N-acetylglucosaminyldiphosphoundecaprenol N-acetyl-beta-D-mannosaminyltransferase